MEKAEKFSGVNFLKTPSGDAMMLVHIDRENLKVLKKKGGMIVIAPEIDPKWIPEIQCLARYDRFRIDEEWVIQPY